MTTIFVIAVVAVLILGSISWWLDGYDRRNL